MKTEHARVIRIGILARRVPYTQDGDVTVLNLSQWSRDLEAFRGLRGWRKELAWRVYWRTNQFTSTTHRQSRP